MTGIIKNKRRNLVLGITMLLVCFFAYQYWVVAETENDSQLISTKNDSTVVVGDEMLQLLSELKTLTLDESIFTDKVFQNLEDFSMKLQPQPAGRNNPFSPIGTDGEYSGVKIDAPAVVKCENQTCFEEQFANCQLAIVEIKSQELSFSTSYQYEILGQKDGYCEVKLKSLTNSNQAWVGKEMICQYDNSKKFEEAVKDISRCSGELYKLMTE